MTLDHYEVFIVKPKYAKNLCKNPSFETQGQSISSVWFWTKGGTNVIERNWDHQAEGGSCLWCEYSNDTDAAIYNITFPAEGTYVASFKIWIPADFDGTAVTVGWQNFAGSSGAVDAEVDMASVDRWQYLNTVITVASGDLTGDLIFAHTGTNPTAGNGFYIDAILIEEGSEPTTYFDGSTEGFLDPNMHEYTWDAGEHESASYRREFTQSGGELIAISDYVDRLGILGLGMPPINNINIPLVDGSERYQYSSAGARLFTIRVVFNDVSLGAIDAKRLALKELIDPLNTAYDQPILLKIIGYDASGKIATRVAEVKCNYVSGLEESRQTSTSYSTDIIFRMSSPYIELEGTKAVKFTTSGTISKPMVVTFDDENQGIDVEASYTTIGDPCNKIKQNPVTGRITIVGNFTALSGISGMDYIAEFNGFNEDVKWRSPKIGTMTPNNIVRDLAFNSSGGTMIVGDFTYIGANPYSYCHLYWPDRSTSSVVFGVGEALKSVAYRFEDGFFYMGGTYLYRQSSTSATKITAFTPSDLRVMKCGPDGLIYIYAHSDTTLYRGSSAGGWTAVGTIAGTSQEIKDFEWDDNGKLWIVGVFDSVDGVDSKNIAYLGDDAWQAIATDFDGNTLNAILNVNGRMLVAGDIQGVGNYNYDTAVFIDGEGIYSPLPCYDSSSAPQGALYDSNGHLWFIANDSTMYYFTGSIVHADNEGDMTYPVFEINVLGNLFQSFINIDTNDKLIFIDKDKYWQSKLTLDCRPEKMQFEVGTGGSLLPYLNQLSDFDFKLRPGDNRIHFLGIVGNPYTNILTMKWKERIRALDKWLL